jgi:fatty-acyl-CoA synthase
VLTGSATHIEDPSHEGSGFGQVGKRRLGVSDVPWGCCRIPGVEALLGGWTRRTQTRRAGCACRRRAHWDGALVAPWCRHLERSRLVGNVGPDGRDFVTVDITQSTVGVPAPRGVLEGVGLGVSMNETGSISLRSAPSYSAGPSTVPLLDDTIGANLARTIDRHPSDDALVEVWSGRRWTYGALGSEVEALATGLLAWGVGTGDRIGIWAPNCAEWVLLQFASAQIGAILVTINPAYRSHELEFVLNQSGVRLLVAAESFKSSDYQTMIDDVRPRCIALDDAIIIGSAEWHHLMVAGHDARRIEAVAAELTCDQPINIQYTSGTTGFPKGATLSHRNILNNGLFVGELCGYRDLDRVCIPVPFYHCFGMTMGNLACTTHGATMVIPSPAFEPRATLAAVAAERCTSLYGVPTMFIAELADPDFDAYELSSLRTGIMAGSPCPVDIMKEVVNRMGIGEVTICYGMTETSPVSTQTRADDSLERRVSTVGQVHPHVEVKIVDQVAGLTVPRGEPGELCTRGYSVMVGYWNEPDKTAEAIDPEGWMHTGDIAVMDDDGYVNITGRIKDMVIRGGENIYPREIEEFLYGHPDIVDVQVIGVPDEKYGEELMVWIKLRPSASPITAETLRAYCSGRIAHYKIPRYVHLVDDFPMTVTGKVRKVEMRQHAIELLGLGQVDAARHA